MFSLDTHRPCECFYTRHEMFRKSTSSSEKKFLLSVSMREKKKFASVLIVSPEKYATPSLMNCY